MEGALTMSVSSTKDAVQMEMSLFTRSAGIETGQGRAGRAGRGMGWADGWAAVLGGGKDRRAASAGAVKLFWHGGGQRAPCIRLTQLAVGVCGVAGIALQEGAAGPWVAGRGGEKRRSKPGNSNQENSRAFLSRTQAHLVTHHATPTCVQ